MSRSVVRRPLATTLALFAVALLAGCGTSDPSPLPQTPRSDEQQSALVRADAVVSAVGRWSRAPTLAEAQTAAAQARVLVTGPRAAALGLVDGDADIRPAVTVGLLPGDDGTPGLASALAGGCVERDVLGGSWARPRERWSQLAERIRNWRPDNNTFPQLPSHAQRVVGWATLTLDTDSLAEATEYSGHAAGHARIVRDALRDPRATPCPG